MYFRCVSYPAIVNNCSNMPSEIIFLKAQFRPLCFAHCKRLAAIFHIWKIGKFVYQNFIHEHLQHPASRSSDIVVFEMSEHQKFGFKDYFSDYTTIGKQNRQKSRQDWSRFLLNVESSERNGLELRFNNKFIMAEIRKICGCSRTL